MKREGYGKGYRYAHDDPAAAEEMTCLPPSLLGRRILLPLRVLQRAGVYVPTAGDGGAAAYGIGASLKFGLVGMVVGFLLSRTALREEEPAGFVEARRRELEAVVGLRHRHLLPLAIAEAGVDIRIGRIETAHLGPDANGAAQPDAVVTGCDLDALRWQQSRKSPADPEVANPVAVIARTGDGDK